MSLQVSLGIGLCVLGALGCTPSSPTEAIGTTRAAISIPWELEQKFAPPDRAMACPFCSFGNGVALRGATAVIASYPAAKTVSNAAYVYVRDGHAWPLQQALEGWDVVPGDDFGASTALDGDTIVVGAIQHEGGRGAAYVFTRQGNTWTAQQKLTAPAPNAGDLFGRSLALSGDTVLVGSYAGVHVYVRTGATWSWQQTMTDGDGFGNTLALEGNTALIGREGPGPQVFERTGSTWSLSQTLTCSDGEGGDYGSQVALSGDTALVSAYSRLTGTVYVFTRSGGVWKQQQKLTGSDSMYGQYFGADAFGQTISLSGDMAIVGSFQHSELDGQAYIFQRRAGVWTETQRLTNPTGAKGTEFGGPSAIDGDRAIFAAWLDNDAYGGAYIYRTLIDGGKPCTSDQDCFGSAVCSAEGVCCDSKCDGTCQSCLSSVKDAGEDGVCGLVVADTDPNDDCAADGDPCGRPGVCDGAGACRSFAAKVTPCGDTACEDGAVKGFLCDGKGGCVTSETECAPFSCNGTGCATKCTDSTQCAPDMRCTVAHRCVPLQDDGTACGAGAVCGSGFCVDGVCCQTECSGQCEACAEPENLGICVAVTGLPRGERESCKPNACDNGMVTDAAICDGKVTDACNEPAPHGCDGYGCDASGCLTACSHRSECAEAFTCTDSGSCIRTTSGNGGPVTFDAPSAQPPDSGMCSLSPRRPTAPPMPVVLMVGLALAARLRRRCLPHP